MSKRYENRYGRGGQWRDRDRADDRGHDRGGAPGYDRSDDRGYMDRAGDEVRSWFGDDDAERRRRMDEARDRHSEGRSYQGRSDWSSGSRPRSDWDRSNEWRSGSPEQSRYRDPASSYSSSDVGRGGDWDPYRYRQSAGTPERSRDRSSGGDYDEDRDRPMNRFGGSPWSVDEGRTDYGAPPTGDYGYGQRAMSPLTGQQQPTRWGRGPKGYQRADNRIHEDVCDRLTYSDVDAENIEVTVQNGEVTLSGTVRDRSDKRHAEDVVEEVSGVRDVHNNIRVQRGDRGDRGDSGDRGIGMSDHTDTQQPGSVLGVNPAAAASTPTGANTNKK